MSSLPLPISGQKADRPQPASEDRSSPAKRARHGDGESSGFQWPDLAAVDNARSVYNCACSSSAARDEKGRDHATGAVARKTADFVRCFSSRVVVRDLISGKPILGDEKQFRTRYQTVFRESGSRLSMHVRARLVFLPSSSEPRGSRPRCEALVLDLERHASLVTPVAANLDGALGLRGPRQQDLWAMYRIGERGERGDSLIDHFWLAPATSVGEAVGEEAVAKLRGGPEWSPEWSAFVARVQEEFGAGYRTKAGPLLSSQVGRCAAIMTDFAPRLGEVDS
jgi:hypothetical protein